MVDQGDQDVQITWTDLRTSRQTRTESPPLLRGELSEAVDEELLEIPMPVAGAVDFEEIRVLHVDDDPSVGELTKTLLEQVDEQFSVVTETTVVEGLNRLDDDFDCVISDYDMPNTNGIEFLEIVRERYPDLPFVLFTGKGSEEVASEAISKGVTDYMQKGSNTDSYEVLANRVRNAVEQYRTQQQFWNALTWYQRLVEQDLTGVFIVQDRAFIYVNERFANLFGYTQAELVGTSPVAIASGPEDETAIRNVLATSHDGTDTFATEFTAQRADGTDIPVEIHGGSIRYEDDPGCIGVVWNRTEQ